MHVIVPNSVEIFRECEPKSTVIASVVEDIREEEGNKSPESQAIGDEVEPEPKERPLQPMEEIDEGHHEIEGNVNVPEENTILEQVTSSKTLECNPFMQFFSQRQTNFVFVMSSDMTFVWMSALTEWNVS